MAVKKTTDNGGGTAVMEPPVNVAVTERSDADETGLTCSISADMFAEDAGGNNFAKDDLAIPFLRSLQSMSPQVNKRDPLYIEGAEPGMFINTVNGQIWPGEPGLVVIPVAYTPSFTEWKPERKGFANDYGADSSIMAKTRKNDKGDDVLPNGNIVVRAGLYYLFIYDEIVGAVAQAAFSLSSSGLKVSRKWNTNIQSLMIRDKNNKPFNPAMYYMAYRLSTVYTENDQGNWFSYDVKPYKPTVELGVMGPEIYLNARSFKKMVTEGAVQVKHEQDQQSESSSEDAPF